MADKMSIPPSEVDRLDFYFVEYLLEDLEEKIAEENKQHKKQEADQARQHKAASSGTKMPKSSSNSLM